MVVEELRDHDSGHVRIMVSFECLSDWSPSDADNSLLLSRDGQLTVDIEPPEKSSKSSTRRTKGTAWTSSSFDNKDKKDKKDKKKRANKNRKDARDDGEDPTAGGGADIKFSNPLATLSFDDDSSSEVSLDLTAAGASVRVEAPPSTERSKRKISSNAKSQKARVRPTGAKNEQRGWMSRVTAEGNVLVTKM
jgi:superfamily II RNA helicase